MNSLCCPCSERGQCIQCNKLDVATVLSSRSFDYIKEQHFMSDLSPESCQFIIRTPCASCGQTCCLLEGWGVEAAGGGGGLDHY